MTTYYVDFVHGLDANNGLGPDASDATNKPWKTIGKLLGAAGMASGDTAYLSPSGPFREVVTAAMTSATVETRIIGDPQNVQGFKNSSGVLVDPGLVTWTAYLTSDVAAPSSTSLFAPASRDYLTFDTIQFIGGSANPSILNQATGTGSTNLTFTNCTFNNSAWGAGCVRLEVAAGVSSDILFDRCRFFGGTVSTGVVGVFLQRHSADYDASVLFRNCMFLTPSNTTAVRPASSGAGAGFGGGVDIVNCSFYGGTAMTAADPNLSTSIPCTVTNSLILTGATGLIANVSGQITEDYCLIGAPTPRTNVTAGANSISGSTLATAALIDIGQAEQQGFLPRPFMEPLAGSGLLNFGASGAPSVDMLNRPRPAGSGLAASPGILTAVGALERHNTAQQETTTVDATGSGIKIVGPGDHELKVPVDASATTISIKARYDTTHAATNKPQVILLANPKLGITAETLTMTAAVDTWETLTTASQTPTAKGVLTLRLVSRAAAGGGIAFFDTVA